MSRADTTLDDWVDTDEIGSEPVYGQDTLSGDCWEPDEPQCQCGVSITKWHSDAGARRMVRVYGDTDEGTVPGCPACVDWGHGEDKMDQKVESVPHAIKALEPTSSVERYSRQELLLREVNER